MQSKKLLIAGGNPTLLIWGCSEENRLVQAIEALRDVEQVGFVEIDKNISKLTMMGDELCINAVLALASQGDLKGEVFASGVVGPVTYVNEDKTYALFSIPYKCFENIVLFDGIGYCLLETEHEFSKEELIEYAERFNLPAFGGVVYTNGAISIMVYVVKTNSVCAETACGSGSVALHIITGAEEIMQPSGQTIHVKKIGDAFEVSAKVTLISEM